MCINLILDGLYAGVMFIMFTILFYYIDESLRLSVLISIKYRVQLRLTNFDLVVALDEKSVDCRLYYNSLECLDQTL